MDREEELIKLLSDLTRVVSGLQDIIESQTTALTLMKDRIEQLERDVICLGKGK